MFKFVTYIYIQPLFAVVIGCILLWFYDKFEHKQYKLSHYVRVALLIYISAFCLIYITQQQWFKDMKEVPIIFGGGGSSSGIISNSSNNFKPINMEFDNGMPMLGGSVEHFNTGLPTF